MTHEEYKDRLRVLKENYVRAVIELKINYANNTLPYRLGDKINGYEIVDIDVIRYNDALECVYFTDNVKAYFQHELNNGLLP